MEKILVNKAKVMFDMFQALRQKENLMGSMTASVVFDQETIASWQQSFEKNLITGRSKRKITAELATPAGEWRTHREDLLQHGFHALQHVHHHGGAGKGLKSRFSLLALLFKTLDQTQMERNDDGKTVISLAVNEWPVELAELLENRRSRQGLHFGHHGHHSCFGAFLSNLNEVRDVDCRASLVLNDRGELETLDFLLTAVCQDEKDASHRLEAQASLRLAA